MMRIKFKWLFTASLLAGAIILDARISVFLKPDPKAPLFKDVLESELMLPKAVENAALAEKGWHTAKVAVSQVGFTEQVNVLKELSLKPGSKVYVRPASNSSLLATTTGQEMVKIVKPGPWTQVTLTKPISVYFLLGDAPAVELVEPIEAIVPVETVVEEVNPELIPESVSKSPEPVAVKIEVSGSKPATSGDGPSNSKPVPHITPEPISNETVVAAEVVTPEPAEAISAFDLLEQADPELVRQSVAPVSSALLEEIQELDPLEVREGSDQPHIAPQLPVEIKPTVTISRQFEGRLIYKKPFFRRPGIRSSSNTIPTNYQLVDADGKRIAYVRVEDIKVGNILNYVKKDVIVTGPLEENPKGNEPIIQGRTIRLNLE